MKKIKGSMVYLTQQVVITLLDDHREEFFGSINRSQQTGELEADINKAYLRAKYGRTTYPLPAKHWKSLGMITV